MKTQHNQDGITLLITLLLMGVLLAVSTSLLNITLKQYQLSDIAFDSEIAFQAATAGLECIVYHDRLQTNIPATSYPNSKFNVPGDGTGVAPETNVTCMNDTSDDLVAGHDATDPGMCGNAACSVPDMVESGEEQRFQFEWGSGPIMCSEVSVYKFFSTTGSVPRMVNGVDLVPGRPCSANSRCTVIQSRGYNVPCGDIGTGARVVEREYTQIY